VTLFYAEKEGFRATGWLGLGRMLGRLVLLYIPIKFEGLHLKACSMLDIDLVNSGWVMQVYKIRTSTWSLIYPPTRHYHNFTFLFNELSKA
jgi:hypothetical protein